MITVTHIDELSGDAQLFPGFANASFQHCIDMQLITDFPKNIRFGFALESETRCPSRHAQPWYLGQRVNWFLGHPVAQILVVFVCAHVDERQHRDGFGWRSATDVLGPLRVTQLLRVEIDQRNDFAVFDLAFANLMQIRPPASVMLEIVCHAPREKNMSGISAIHHSLRGVNAGTRDVRLFVQVGNFIYRATVNSHSDSKFGMMFELFANLESAEHWRFGAIAKNERAAVASW